MIYSDIFLVGKLVFQFSAFKGFFCVVYKFKYIIFYQMMRLFWYFS